MTIKREDRIERAARKEANRIEMLMVWTFGPKIRSLIEKSIARFARRERKRALRGCKCKHK
jgi:hypothetical protein